MEKQTRFIMFFVLFLSACGVSPILPIPTSTVALVTQESPFLPTMTQTPPPTLPIQTVTLEPTETSNPKPTETPTLLNTVIPIPPDITEVREGFLSYNTDTDSIFFLSETVQIEDLRLFYMTELINAGWTWVYTDIGISQVPSSQTSLLILEFKKDGDKLGILAYGPEEGGAMAFAAIGYSGYFQFLYLLAGMGDSASVSRPSKEDIQSTSMQFSSPFLKFQHPSSWIAQDQLMQTFNVDDNGIYILEAPPSCNADFEPCFVTFSDWSGGQYNPPVSIRIQSDLSGLSLEQADALRWQQLNSPSNPYIFPEDLAATGSLQTLETRTYTLANGAPAIQRTFQWKQLKLDQTIIIGSYILFLSQGEYVEFHTDYTSAEWEFMKPLIEQVITSMESTP